jgi:hypothetical protein
LALVSMNTMPCSLANASPSSRETLRLASKSLLFPAHQRQWRCFEAWTV